MQTTCSRVTIPAEDAIVYWQNNATLRRFLIVSSLCLGWIGCDLLLLAMTEGRLVGHGLWNTLESAVGIDARRILFDYLPINALRLHLYTAYSLPAFGFLTLVLLDRLVCQGETGLPQLVTWCGFAFIVGGAMLDISVTVGNSPDLALEGNPYVRVLLDSEHSLMFVYAHALITQSLYITLFCGVWLGFLKHRRTIANTIAASGPTTVLQFFKAATGGAHLTVRQWLLPVRWSEFALMYHYIWLIAIPVVFGISLFRWYAALEWMGIVEPDARTRIGIVLHGVCSTLAIYFVVMWRMTRRLQTEKF
ncbi:MAG: hypothetical protein JSS49_17065 [Planctomycetes bacterium]|nr:hypothetical protein [Planctomycetota bacterium]